jgi:hypothetical protein
MLGRGDKESSWIGANGRGYGESMGMRVGGNVGIRRGRREAKGFGRGLESDTLNVDYNVVWVLSEDETEATGLRVGCSRVRRDCLHRDNNMFAFAIDDWVSPSDMRVAATSSEVM